MPGNVSGRAAACCCVRRPLTLGGLDGGEFRLQQAQLRFAFDGLLVLAQLPTRLDRQFELVDHASQIADRPSAVHTWVHEPVSLRGLAPASFMPRLAWAKLEPASRYRQWL